MLLFAYLIGHIVREEDMELSKIIVITEAGCIVEILDDFAANIGDCQAQPG